MMWQDFIFLAGSLFSIVVLAPTLRDKMASVPLATSAPSAFIGTVYSITFFSLGMTFSGLGALAAGTMWTLIAAFRSPEGAVATERLSSEISSVQSNFPTAD